MNSYCNNTNINIDNFYLLKFVSKNYLHKPVNRQQDV